MAFRGLACGLLFSLVLPRTVNSGKNCASPHVHVVVLAGQVRDHIVQYEEIVTSDINPPYATTTVTVAVGTLLTTRTESKSVTEFSLDSGCVVSSGSSIYTLTAPTTVTQEGTNPVSFWVRPMCPEPFVELFCGIRLTLQLSTGPIDETTWNEVDTKVRAETNWHPIHCRPKQVQRLRRTSNMKTFSNKIGNSRPGLQRKRAKASCT